MQEKEIDSFAILSSVLENGGVSNISDATWVEIAESLGIDGMASDIKILKSHYKLEFEPFEK